MSVRIETSPREVRKPLRTAGKVRVAIIGVGNCASSLVQGVEFYKNASAEENVPGLMHVDLGGYHVRDIEFSAAFDIDRSKVGKDLSEAIYAEPNNTYVFSKVPRMGVRRDRDSGTSGSSSSGSTGDAGSGASGSTGGGDTRP